VALLRAALAIAIFGFFVWVAFAVSRKLDRIEARLTEIRDRLPRTAAD
jgi:hypothetical protein